ncbi:SurA N-terminal domain-containing protein [Edaphobacter aggregans]|uniref:SurA N-terminal domain-containing protein n=1 Tax=Edaphobacter aggregans TaxID=570835 RepID=UPI000552149E|nr:SurA N-terminal domain-containing protein [Edaphobacter aggregans]
MRISAHNPALRWSRGCLALLALAATVAAKGQQPAAPVPAPPSASSPLQAGAAVPAVEEQGTVIDGVVAVVNGDVVLESDVDEERRFEKIQPYRGSANEFSRDRAVQRLIDRTLIQQQAELEPAETAVSDQELDKQLQTLRNDIPACREYHCETDAGWAKFLGDNGFTVSEFRQRWRKRMKLLRLIEVRFRSGIRITNDEIKDYYEKTMLPEYARQHVTPPKLDSISPRIEEVLLQQQVGNLMRDWLKSLRAQGSVWVMKPGEVAP